MLTEPSLQYLARLGKVCLLDAAEILFRKGEPGAEMYVILEGQVELLFEGASPAKRLEAGEFFGELALLSQPTRTGTAVSVTPSRLLRLDRDAFSAVARERPELFHSILWQVCTYLLASERRLLRELESVRAEPARLRELIEGAARGRARLESEESFVLSWGASSMQPIVDALRRVARTGATVLLQGESGTGKEIAARAVHAWSPRHAGPFVALNCAALSEQLAESELFGHEKGAFTGAASLRRGWIELASEGSLFFDEVGELPLLLQGKLLRVLETRTFTRVGGSRPLQADVRWLAATNRDLKSMVAQGQFREDLYYRLAVFTVELPPLRRRLEDIRPLAELLLDGIRKELDRPELLLSPEALALLESAAWPGNVRQLRNVLSRAAILAEGQDILPRHLALESVPLAAPGSSVGTLDELEREAIFQALSAAGGNRKKAAEQLGIGLRTLYDKLKRYQS